MKWLYDELQKRGPKAHLIWSEDDYEPLTERIAREYRAQIRSFC